MTSPIVVKGVERLRCMCGTDNRQCSHCGHPFEATRHPCSDPPGPPVLDHCPKCGQPSTAADTITGEKSRALRAEKGLIP